MNIICDFFPPSLQITDNAFSSVYYQVIFFKCLEAQLGGKLRGTLGGNEAHDKITLD